MGRGEGSEKKEPKSPASNRPFIRGKGRRREKTQNQRKIQPGDTVPDRLSVKGLLLAGERKHPKFLELI